MKHKKEKLNNRSSILLVSVLFLFASLLAGTQSAFADIICKPSEKYPPQTLAPAINPAPQYVGNDMDIGSALYRVKMTTSSTVGVSCDSAFSLQSYIYVSAAPSGSPVTMNTVYGTAPVYPTNVAGVGVIVFATNPSGGNLFFTDKKASAAAIFSQTSAGDAGQNIAFDFALVKTGSIASGSVVNPASFPHISWWIPTYPGYYGLAIGLLNYSFTGSIPLITQTCTTPDVTVNLGQHDMAEEFKGKGAITKWIDSSIILRNCPTFSGYHAINGADQHILDSGSLTGTLKNSNFFTISLKSANPVTNNIIDIDSGSDSASGVGVQLGYSDNLDADPLSPTQLWSENAQWDITSPTDGRSTIKIPLAARYYQTANTVTPGKANASVTFNIDYK